MDKTAAKILQFINKNSSIKKQCNVFGICDNLNLDYDIALYYLKYLMSENLIEYFDENYDDKDWSYRSTQKGKNYFKNKREQKFLSVCNGILFPIAVTLLTNLILAIIEFLLK